MSYFYDQESDLLKAKSICPPSTSLFLNDFNAPGYLPSEFDLSDSLDPLLSGVLETSVNLEEMMERMNEMPSVYEEQQPQIKEEGKHLESEEHRYYGEDSQILPDMAYLSSYSPVSSCSTPRNSSSGNKRKRLDKNSEEYLRRRKMNNLAVKKSREKAKAESRKTEQKVASLTAENKTLSNRVNQLSEEIKFLRGIFTKMGGLPQHIQQQLSKLDSVS